MSSHRRSLYIVAALVLWVCSHSTRADVFGLTGSRGSAELQGLPSVWDTGQIRKPAEVAVYSKRSTSTRFSNNGSLDIEAVEQRLFLQTGEARRADAVVEWDQGAFGKIVPMLSFVQRELDGRQNSEQRVSSQIAHVYQAKGLRLVSSLAWSETKADGTDPIHGSARSGQSGSVSFVAQREALFGVSSLRLNSGLSWFSDGRSLGPYPEKLTVFSLGLQLKLD